MDVNRQAWTAGQDLVIHSGENYVGLRTERLFVAAGQPLPLEMLVTDLDGRPVPGRTVSLEAARMEYGYRKGKWREEAAEVQNLDLVSGPETVRTLLEPRPGGRYRITAVVRDVLGRPNQTRITVWVAGGRQPAARRVEREKILLVPDRQEYHPGDTAEILIQSPFEPAEGLVIYARSGLVRSERFSMAGPAHTLRVPLDEAHVPNLHVMVHLVGAAPRTDEFERPVGSVPTRPAYASGEICLSISPRNRTLTLELKPEAGELEPGQSTWVDLAVRDSSGRPAAGAEALVIVVDEAILSLTGYDLPDPIGVFYSERSSNVTACHLRQSILLSDTQDLVPGPDDEAPGEGEVLFSALDDGLMPMALAMEDAGAGMAVRGLKGAGPDRPEPIRLREDFRAWRSSPPRRSRTIGARSGWNSRCRTASPGTG